MAVRQVENVLDILEYFAIRKAPATLSELSDDLELPRSSTFKILETLIARGYIYTPNQRFGYYPSPTWLENAQAISEAEPLPEILRQFVKEIAQATGETVYLIAPAGMNVVMVMVIESEAAIRYSARVGKLLPIHATAAGRAVLSQYSKAVRRSILSKVVYERYQSNTLMSTQAVEEEIKASLERGWFQNNTEYTADVCGIALRMPVHGRKMALALGGPSFRMQPRVHEIGTFVKKRMPAILEQLEQTFGAPVPPDPDAE